MLKKLLLSFALLLLIAGISLNLLAPGLLFNATQSTIRHAAGLSIKTITLGKYTYSYIDNEQLGKPIVLMLHGFTSNKDNWARMAFFLKEDYHIIALDLLGHGDSPRDPKANYGISQQVQRVHEISLALGLESFHIVGSSMGGYIAAMYTATHPEQVLTTHLFSNAGVHMPQKSDMVVALENKEPHPLIMRGADDAERFFAYVFGKAPFFTQSIKAYYAEQSAAHVALYQRIFNSFHGHEGYPEPLEARLKTIQSPVHVIWGSEDRVLHVSSIETMKPLLNNARYHIMDGYGHLPMLESPQRSAELFKDFINTAQ